MKKTCQRYHQFTHVYHEPQSYEVQFLRYRARHFYHFGPFFALPPTPNNQENQNFEKMKKASGDVIMLNLCNKNHDQMMYAYQARKFGGNNLFITASFPSLIKDGNNNLFPQIHLHNTNAFFEDLTGKYFYNLPCKLHFLHIDLPTLHKSSCFSTTIPPLLIYLECSTTQCVIKN